jgi:hypothetical protein
MTMPPALEAFAAALEACRRRSSMFLI